MTTTGKEDLSDVVQSVERSEADAAKKREATAAFDAFVMAQEAKRSKPRARTGSQPAARQTRAPS